MDAEPAGESPVLRAPGAASSDISRRMVQLFRERLGRGPTKARTTMNTNTVMVVFEDTLTKAELTLHAAGRDIEQMRADLSNAIRPEATAIVEGVVGREVRGFVSGVDPEANLAIMVFMLEEVEETGRLGISDASSNGEVDELMSHPGEDPGR